MGRQLWRVVEGLMQNAGVAGEDRAILCGVIAHGDDHVKVRIRQIPECLRQLCRDVDARFGHDRHGQRVQPVCLDAR
jgi:hypothetical protein